MARALSSGLVTSVRGSVGDTTFRVLDGEQVMQARGGGGTRVTPITSWQYVMWKHMGVVWRAAKTRYGAEALTDHLRLTPDWWRSFARGGLGAMNFYRDFGRGTTRVNADFPLPGLRSPHTPVLESFVDYFASNDYYAELLFRLSPNVSGADLFVSWTHTDGSLHYTFDQHAGDSLLLDLYNVKDSLSLAVCRARPSTEPFGSAGVLFFCTPARPGTVIHPR